MKRIWAAVFAVWAIGVIILMAQTTQRLPLSVDIPIGRTKMFMLNNTIAPAGPNIDLKTTITAPVQFQLGFFPADSMVTLFINNSGSNKITWPAGMVVIGQPMPINSARIAVVFEEVMGEIWAAPAALP